MMGTKVRDFPPVSNLSLEELIPEDNFYHRLDETLDLSFIKELVRGCYACSRRPSVDPVGFFRLQLVMVFEGIRSERQLMEVVADRLSVRWYLGYRPVVAHLLPVAPSAAPRYRRRQVRYRRERLSYRAGQRPGVHGVAPQRGQTRHLWQGGVRLRRTRGPLSMPGQRALETPGREEVQQIESRGEDNHLPDQGLILPEMRTEGEMHLQQALGRILRRGPFEGCLDRVRAYQGTYIYEKALRKRQV